jgi:hypothetical protein
MSNTVNTARRGRPANPQSNRQARLSAQASRVAAGGTISKGIPAVEGSARQQRLAEKAARIAAGEVIKRGRKAKAKETVAA